MRIRDKKQVQFRGEPWRLQHRASRVVRVARGFTVMMLSMGGQRIGTRTATGKLMADIIGAIATFERDLMIERQREGIAKAKAEGKYRAVCRRRSGRQAT